MKIHGKEYTPVSERVKEFHEKYPKGDIQTNMEYDGDWVRCRAIVYPSREETRYFTGHAEENRKDGTINQTSATENCETSAIGRALGFLGLGSVDSIASAEEVISAINKQDTITVEDPFIIGKIEYNKCLKCEGSVKAPFKICWKCKTAKTQ